MGTRAHLRIAFVVCLAAGAALGQDSKPRPLDGTWRGTARLTSGHDPQLQVGGTRFTLTMPDEESCETYVGSVAAVTSGETLFLTCAAERREQLSYDDGERTTTDEDLSPGALTFTLRLKQTVAPGKAGRRPALLSGDWKVAGRSRYAAWFKRFAAEVSLAGFQTSQVPARSDAPRDAKRRR